MMLRRRSALKSMIAACFWVRAGPRGKMSNCTIGSGRSVMGTLLIEAGSKSPYIYMRWVCHRYPELVRRRSVSVAQSISRKTIIDIKDSSTTAVRRR